VKDSIEFKTEQMKALIKRRNSLSKKYENTVPTEIPLEVKSELDFIDKLLQEFDIDQSIYDAKPKMIGIKNSRDEEWYFQQMVHWVNRHPSALNVKFSRSSIYKFVLHFFVENIALNSSNASLSISELAQKVNGVSSKKDDLKLITQMSNIENLLGFLLTMQQRQLEYIPEVIDPQNGFVKYAINPINQTEFQQ